MFVTKLESELLSDWRPSPGWVYTRFQPRCETVGFFSIHWEQCRQKGFPAKFVTKLESVLLSELETFARMGAVSCVQQAILLSCSC